MGRKMVNIVCKNCNKEFTVRESYVKRGNGKFCSISCSNSYRSYKKNKDKIKYAKENPLKWSYDIAYLTGLIVSDGCLQKKRPRISFVNKEFELIGFVKDIVKESITGKTYKPIKCSKNESSWWLYQFTSRKYYYFLKDLGVTPNKSLTIKELNIPNKYFADFLRGCIDGDGCFSVKKKDNLDYLSLDLSSGSKLFLIWVHKNLKALTKINGGSICKMGDNYKLNYSSGDTIMIFNYIYTTNSHYLNRKYNIANNFIINNGHRKYKYFF